MTSAQIIKEARTRAGITQAELARRLHTAQPAIAKYEAGKVDPRYETLRRIVAACGFALVTAIEEPQIDPHDATILDQALKLTPKQRLAAVKSVSGFLSKVKRNG